MTSDSAKTPLQKAVAENSADVFARTQDKMLPELWELNRWMLASLLAINSAAAIAVYGAQDLSYAVKAAACWLFIYGGLAALGSGFVLTFVLRGMERAVSEAQSYWAAVAGGAARSPEAENKHIAIAKSASRWSYAPQVLLYISVGLFLFGIGKL